MKSIKHIIRIFLLIGLYQISQSNASASWLEVIVKGAEPEIGQIEVSLFNSEGNFLKEPLIKRFMPVNAEGQAIFRFDSLEPGQYAVSTVYDKNMDGILNTGFMRIPKEPYGFSNNAKGLFGPPSFEKAAFQIDELTIITINLTKAK